ncbi:hypothetical protein HK100_005699 [Physocladia obscura]|uniref:Mif2/CENP-C cupin domain-containing protein n=1 Tax=Physocladia obscura TaxID=109957 RepID=A0AAD5SST9_9FUNG|nr:hypothetical protein HK100_005699 [Physocladia obscura]
MLTTNIENGDGDDEAQQPPVSRQRIIQPRNRPNKYLDIGVRGRKTGWVPPTDLPADANPEDYFRDLDSEPEDTVEVSFNEPEYQPEYLEQFHPHQQEQEHYRLHHRRETMLNSRPASPEYLPSTAKTQNLHPQFSSAHKLQKFSNSKPITPIPQYQQLRARDQDSPAEVFRKSTLLHRSPVAPSNSYQRIKAFNQQQVADPFETDYGIDEYANDPYEFSEPIPAQKSFNRRHSEIPAVSRRQLLIQQQTHSNPRRESMAPQSGYQNNEVSFRESFAGHATSSPKHQVFRNSTEVYDEQGPFDYDDLSGPSNGTHHSVPFVQRPFNTTPVTAAAQHRQQQQFQQPGSIRPNLQQQRIPIAISARKTSSYGDNSSSMNYNRLQAHHPQNSPRNANTDNLEVEEYESHLRFSVPRTQLPISANRAKSSGGGGPSNLPTTPARIVSKNGTNETDNIAPPRPGNSSKTQLQSHQLKAKQARYEDADEYDEEMQNGHHKNFKNGGSITPVPAAAVPNGSISVTTPTFAMKKTVAVKATPSPKAIPVVTPNSTGNITSDTIGGKHRKSKLGEIVVTVDSQPEIQKNKSHEEEAKENENQNKETVIMSSSKDPAWAYPLHHKDPEYVFAVTSSAKKDKRPIQGSSSARKSPSPNTREEIQKRATDYESSPNNGCLQEEQHYDSDDGYNNNENGYNIDTEEPESIDEVGENGNMKRYESEIYGGNIVVEESDGAEDPESDAIVNVEKIATSSKSPATKSKAAPKAKVQSGAESAKKRALVDSENEKQAVSSSSSSAPAKKKPKVVRAKPLAVVNEEFGRSKRHRVAPLQYWANEKADYSMRRDEATGTMLPEFVGIIKTETPEEPAIYKKYYKSRASSYRKKKERIVLESPVMPVMNIETKQEEELHLVFTEDMLEPQVVHGENFQFQRLFNVKDVCGSGIVVLPKNGVKPNKSAGSSAVVIYVICGKVRVLLHRNKFEVGEGTHILVPPGNQFGMENIGNEESRLLIVQTRKKLDSSSTSAFEISEQIGTASEQLPTPAKTVKKSTVKEITQDAKIESAKTKGKKSMIAEEKEQKNGKRTGKSK